MAGVRVVIKQDSCTLVCGCLETSAYSQDCDMIAGNVAHAREVHVVLQASMGSCSQAYSDADENQLNCDCGEVLTNDVI